MNANLSFQHFSSFGEKSMGNGRKVLALPRSVIFKNYRSWFNGFVRSTVFDFPDTLDSTDHFVDKEPAEKDVRYKQIIPYVVLMATDGEILTYTRTQSSGEKRLASRSSIGIGGHIEIDDVLNDDNKELCKVIKRASIRETIEELALPASVDEKYISNNIMTIGYINDESDMVGRVHFGVARLLMVNQKLKDEFSSAPDEHVDNIEWLKPLEIIEKKTLELESWSKILVTNFIGFN